MIDASWTYPVLSWTATFAIHSTLLIGGVGLALRLRPRTSPLTRDLLWKVALTGGIVTSTAHLGLGLHSPAELVFASPGAAAPAAAPAAIEPAIAERFAIRDHGIPEPRVRPSGGAWTTTPWIASPFDAPPELARPWIAQEPGRSATVVAGPPSAAPPVLPAKAAAIVTGLLALGALLALIRLGAQALQLRRALRGRREVVEDPMLESFLVLTSSLPKRRRKLRLRASNGLRSPVALLGGEVCVPERAIDELDARQQRAMLAHEVAHLVRRDPEWLCAGAFLEAVFFFQPLIRYARRQLAEAAEHACDDWAARKTGDGLSLARCLERVATWIEERPLPLAAAMAHRRSPLVDRVRRLVTPGRARGGDELRTAQKIGLGLGLLSLCAWLAPALSLGGCASASHEPPPLPPPEPLTIAVPSAPAPPCPPSVVIRSSDEESESVVVVHSQCDARPRTAVVQVPRQGGDTVEVEVEVEIPGQPFMGQPFPAPPFPAGAFPPAPPQPPVIAGPVVIEGHHGPHGIHIHGRHELRIHGLEGLAGLAGLEELKDLEQLQVLAELGDLGPAIAGAVDAEVARAVARAERDAARAEREAARAQRDAVRAQRDAIREAVRGDAAAQSAREAAREAVRAQRDAIREAARAAARSERDAARDAAREAFRQAELQRGGKGRAPKDLARDLERLRADIDRAKELATAAKQCGKPMRDRDLAALAAEAQRLAAEIEALGEGLEEAVEAVEAVEEF